MLWKNSQKSLRQFSQKAHDNCTVSMACLRWKEDQKISCVNFEDGSLIMVFVYACWFWIPLSFAECSGVGRVNSPGKANLALRARIARQGGLVGNSWVFGHPERFFSGQMNRDGILLVTFLLLLKEKWLARQRRNSRVKFIKVVNVMSNSPAGRDPQY